MDDIEKELEEIKGHKALSYEEARERMEVQMAAGEGTCFKLTADAAKQLVTDLFMDDGEEMPDDIASFFHL